MSKPTASSRPPTSKARCPICSSPTELEYRPFCSRRCADVDLSRWLKGAYAIPGDIETDEDGEDSQVAPSRQQPAGTGKDDEE